MYRIRPGCAAYARMNIPVDQAGRMMYIGDLNEHESSVFGGKILKSFPPFSKKFPLICSLE